MKSTDRSSLKFQFAPARARQIANFLFVLVTIVFVRHSANGQGTFDTSDKLPWPNNLSFSYYRVNIDRIAPQDAFGFNAEYYIGRRWGVEWSIAFADQYAHLGLGSFCGPLVIWLHNKNIAPGGYFFVLTMAVLSALEQTNYHIPLARGIELVPYVSIWKGRIINAPEYKDEGGGSWSGGLRLSIIVRRTVFLNISAEGGKLYAPGTPAIVLYGINLGYIFRGREFNY